MYMSMSVPEWMRVPIRGAECLWVYIYMYVYCTYTRLCIMCIPVEGVIYEYPCEGHGFCGYPCNGWDMCMSISLFGLNICMKLLLCTNETRRDQH